MLIIYYYNRPLFSSTTYLVCYDNQRSLGNALPAQPIARFDIVHSYCASHDVYYVDVCVCVFAFVRVRMIYVCTLYLCIYMTVS